MLTVAVLSDTHMPGHIVGLPPRALPPKIFSYLKKVDLILHAGDIVEASLLTKLATYAPVHAVKGNWDTHRSVADLPEILELKLNNVPVSMIHNSGQKPYRRSRMRKRFPDARVVLFGHSRQPGIENIDDLLLINPGSALSTFALLYIGKEKRVYGEIVDLESGIRYSTEHFPPLSTKRPQGADFTSVTKSILLEKANHKCQVCSSGQSLEIDHIIPVSNGGKGTVENGQVLCRRCHLEKTRKARRDKELDRHVEKDPYRIVSSDTIDWLFNRLVELGASLSIRREELYGLTVSDLVATLREKGLDFLALDLVRRHLLAAHYEYYGISFQNDQE